jgi:hypothetical protein
MPADGEDVAALAARVRREIGQADVLTDRQELRTYECGGPAVYTVVPAHRPGSPEARALTHQGG